MFWLLKPTSLTILAFILGNLLICRWITSRLIYAGYMTYGSVEFKRAVMFWFVPIMGVLGLGMLYVTHVLKGVFKWFFFNHHKPAPVIAEPVKIKRKYTRKPKPQPIDVNKLTEEEIMRKAGEIANKRAKELWDMNAKRVSQRKKAKGY